MSAVRKSVALSYTRAMDAPVVIANGRNALADRMLEIAAQCGITIIRDPFLADILSEAQIGSCIPGETYEAVAAIFAFLEDGIDENWL